MPKIHSRSAVLAKLNAAASRILGVEELQLVAESHIEFELKELDGHVTNVNVFAGVQFQQYGLHHVEILLDNNLILRYPLPVVRV